MSWTILDGVRLMFQRVRHFDLLDPAKDSFAFVERRHQGGGVPVQDTISPRKEMAERLAVGTSPVELENTTRARAVILIDRKSGP
ncbi:MAG TPA: hypothetical protein VNO35_20965 [Steroidobacteraceae bacterium]|nr:hypothetical protein [Steroidobacteraceae bacterium]